MKNRAYTWEKLEMAKKQTQVKLDSQCTNMKDLVADIDDKVIKTKIQVLVSVFNYYAQNDPGKFGDVLKTYMDKGFEMEADTTVVQLVEYVVNNSTENELMKIAMKYYEYRNNLKKEKDNIIKKPKKTTFEKPVTMPTPEGTKSKSTKSEHVKDPKVSVKNNTIKTKGSSAQVSEMIASIVNHHVLHSGHNFKDELGEMNKVLTSVSHYLNTVDVSTDNKDFAEISIRNGVVSIAGTEENILQSVLIMVSAISDELGKDILANMKTRSKD